MNRPAGPTTLPHSTWHVSADRIAQSPPEHRGLRRDQVRLLVVEPGAVAHRHFHHLPQHLRPGDLLVVNSSATLPAELDGTSPAHGGLVVHVGTSLDDQHSGPLRRVVELRTAPDAAEPVLDGQQAEEIQVGGGVRFRLVAPYPRPGSSPTGDGSRLWQAHVLGTDSLEDHLELQGRPISYGYLAERFPLSDYQTIFALHPGSSEMPSAARPFTPELVTRLIAGGVGVVPVTLHTGLSSQEAGEPPQAEWFEVSPATARVVNETRRAGDRVVAVGTTVARALESAVAADGTVHPRTGWTELVITPDRPVRAIDGIITGFHDPEATHLQLIEAVAGAGIMRDAYDAAEAEGYLWHEFGDSSLLLAR